MSYVLGVFAAEKEKEKQREALRDNFAGLAMQGLIQEKRYTGVIGVNGYEFSVAAMAYLMADAMLKEREKVDD